MRHRLLDAFGRLRSFWHNDHVTIVVNDQVQFDGDYAAMPDKLKADWDRQVKEFHAQEKEMKATINRALKAYREQK